MRSRGIGYRSLLSDLQRSLELASGYTYNPIISIQYLGVLWTYQRLLMKYKRNFNRNKIGNAFRRKGFYGRHHTKTED